MDKVPYDPTLIDRFAHAAKLAHGRRVLDIGGQHPRNHDITHPFGVSYRKIADASSAYEVFDRDSKPGVKYVGDLNQKEGRERLAAALRDYKPETIFCMEILEHLNYPCEIMDLLSDYLLSNKDATLFLTIPNNGSWVLNALNWHTDHNVAFFKSIASRFVGRSGLGRCSIIMRPCMQRYKWYWWIIYLASFCQPFNWGFEIRAQ